MMQSRESGPASPAGGQGGQVLLIVVLTMVVSLTIALSVASRSIVGLRTTTEEENSQRAFSAAEAGVEQVLKTGVNIGSELSLGNASSIKKADVTEVRGTEFLVNSGNSVAKDDGVDIWLVEHTANGSLNFSSGWQLLTEDAMLTVYWGSSADLCDTNAVAALEIIVVSGSNFATVTKRYALDPCAARRAVNNFSAPDGSGSVDGRNFPYRTTIHIRNTSKGLIARIVPLYASSPMGVKGCNFDIDSSNPSCNALPSQGKKIEATGVSGGTSRKVTFYQGYPELPSEFFHYVLFSP